ncbi:MAG: hypothetical protein ABIQ41_03560 [Gemmatimonadales bacterium]
MPAKMTYEAIVETLSYAAGQEQMVRIVTTTGTSVHGFPTSLDTHLTAHEVYLLPPGDDDTEIAINLEAIELVELM